MNWTDFGIGFGCCALALNVMLGAALFAARRSRDLRIELVKMLTRLLYS